MLKIAHRINDPDHLARTPREYGVEMDVHAYGDRLVVHHDAFVDGIEFERWLDAYDHKFLILNVKEEGIETAARDTVIARGITDFFMLDLSFPALMKMIRGGERRLAVRVSEYEAVAGALTLAGKADWIWLDIFHGFPINRGEYDAMRYAEFKFCLVSPEMHGRSVDEITDLRSYMEHQGMSVDAVCTKHPELW